MLAESVEDVLKQSDVVIIGNRSREHQVVLGDLKNGHRIIDL